VRFARLNQSREAPCRRLSARAAWWQLSLPDCPAW
jgi:hypothetical protein